MASHDLIEANAHNIIPAICAHSLYLLSHFVDSAEVNLGRHAINLLQLKSHIVQLIVGLNAQLVERLRHARQLVGQEVGARLIPKQVLLTVPQAELVALPAQESLLYFCEALLRFTRFMQLVRVEVHECLPQVHQSFKLADVAQHLVLWLFALSLLWFLGFGRETISFLGGRFLFTCLLRLALSLDDLQ